VCPKPEAPAKARSGAKPRLKAEPKAMCFAEREQPIPELRVRRSASCPE
jgi:hypothetical protein